MKKALIVTLTLLLLTSVSAFAETINNKLIGNWVFIPPPSSHGMTALYMFSNDGTLKQIFGGFGEIIYKTDGSLLSYIDKESKDNVWMNFNYELNGDKLVLVMKDIPSNRTEMTRTNTSTTDKSSIIGRWSFRPSSGGKAIMEFNSNGLGYAANSLQTKQGQFKLNDNLLTMAFKGEPLSKFLITVDNELLTFKLETKHYNDPEKKDYVENYKRYKGPIPE